MLALLLTITSRQGGFNVDDDTALTILIIVFVVGFAWGHWVGKGKPA